MVKKDVENAADARMPGDRMEDKRPGSSLVKAKRKSKSGIHLDPSKKGSLHTALGVPQGQEIPPGRLSAAKANASGNLAKKLQFAVNAKKFKH